MIPRTNNFHFSTEITSQPLRLRETGARDTKKGYDMTDIIFDALRFATDAHTGQFRKSTQVPYIVHPVAVMQYLIQHNASGDAVAAGILHDTLEDTPTTENDLRRVFGDRITNLVIGASEPDKSQTWEQR